MKPSEVLTAELSSSVPFARLFGCVEKEEAAAAILRELVANGDNWDAPVSSAHMGYHQHMYGVVCDPSHLVSGGRVTREFIMQVCRMAAN
jgi:hypothetical protein